MCGCAKCGTPYGTPPGTPPPETLGAGTVGGNPRTADMTADMRRLGGGRDRHRADDRGTVPCPDCQPLCWGGGGVGR